MYPKMNTFKMVSICLTVFFLGIMNAHITHAHAENYSFVTEWGSYGIGDGQFEYPSDVAVDLSDNVYVADSGNGCIKKFDSNGNFITKWGSVGSDDGQFIGTDSIAVDSSGYVYALDRINGRIEKFDSNGNFITKWDPTGNGFKYIIRSVGMTVDSSGNVYFVYDDKGLIRKFDSNGKLLTEWGPYGTDDGQFSGVAGIAVDSSGNVHIADNGMKRIEKFDSNGKLIAKWGSLGMSIVGNISDGQFHDISDIEVDSSGNVYVSDYMEYRIQKFDSDGNFITKWNSTGPSGIAVDSSGNVYVSNMINDRIEKFAPENENIFYPGINWITGDKGYTKAAKNLNAKMVNSYMNTRFDDGAFQVYLASKSIGTETNFLSNYSDNGTYNIAFAHSGGTRTLVSKIETKKVKANYVVLAAPALITQEELQGLIMFYGVKKVVVIQSSQDILNLLNVDLERNYAFENGQTLSTATVWLNPLSMMFPVNFILEHPVTSNYIIVPIIQKLLSFKALSLDVLKTEYYNSEKIVADLYLSLLNSMPDYLIPESLKPSINSLTNFILDQRETINYNIVQSSNEQALDANFGLLTLEITENNNNHFLTVDLTPYLKQSGQKSNIIPPEAPFWIGGAKRSTATLFSPWSKNNDMNYDIIVVNISPNAGEDPKAMHKRLCTIMAENYSNSTYPFDGSIPGLKGLK